MKLAPSRKKKNRPLEVSAGCLKSVLAVVLLWIGLNSYLIGRAYYLERGAWLPRVAGVIGVLAGIYLLWRGVGQFVGNVRRRDSDLREEL